MEDEDEVMAEDNDDGFSPEALKLGGKKVNCCFGWWLKRLSYEIDFKNFWQTNCTELGLSKGQIIYFFVISWPSYTGTAYAGLNTFSPYEFDIGRCWDMYLEL